LDVTRRDVISIVYKADESAPNNCLIHWNDWCSPRKK